MLKPPVARREIMRHTRHGAEVEDAYHWLRRKGTPEVIEHLEAENAYAEAVMRPTAELQQALYDEMLGRIKETDLSAPQRFGDYFYYSRTEQGQQYPIHCRKRGSLEAPEEVLLDENRLAEGTDYFRLGVFELSPDHNLLAFSVDTDGAERYTLRVKNLRTGELFDDVIAGTYASAEWANDNRTLFYSMLDHAHRPYRLYRHELGGDPARDSLVFQEDDVAYFLQVYKTKDQRYLMLELGSNTTAEVWFLDADTPTEPFRLIHPRQTGMEYAVAHHGERFLILTNDDAVNFKLVEAPEADPQKAHWKDVIPHRREVKLDRIDVFADHAAILQREDGIRRIKVYDLPDFAPHDVEFPEPVYVVYGSANPEFDTHELRFVYSSLLTPDSVFDYDMRTRQRRLVKQTQVLGDFDPADYVSARIHAKAADGTRIPISLVYRKGLQRDGSHPALLYGYGAYGISVDPRFDSTRLSLLDRGFVYAIGHVRGGGDMGRPWYDDGKLLNKRNSFTDFIACAEHLIAEGYTAADRLVIRGGSAGGLLVGAAANMRPELFRVVVAKVPFVDIVTTMSDPTLPLTVTEWEEWGNPQVAEFHDYIRSYSPYDNVRAAGYPHMLITGGLNDPRVSYWEPAKWAARLRELKTDDNLLLVKTEMGAGHGGPSGRYSYLKELAFEYAFILGRLP